MRVHYQWQYADQESVRSMPYPDYHGLRALVNIFNAKTLPDRSVSKVAKVLLHVVQEVIVDALLIGEALVP